VTKELGKKGKKKNGGDINAQSSLAIVTGLSQLTMADLRKGKKGSTREEGRRRGCEKEGRGSHKRSLLRRYN